MKPYRPDPAPEPSPFPEGPDRNHHEPCEWFYTQRGETYGPVSSTELRAAAHLGFVGPDDLVRRKDRGTWIAAREICGLFEIGKEKG